MPALWVSTSDNQCHPVSSGDIWEGEREEERPRLRVRLRLRLRLRLWRGPPPLGGLDPLHPLQAYEHWVFLRSHPLHLPLQPATGRYGSAGQRDHRTTGLPDYGTAGRLDCGRVQGPNFWTMHQTPPGYERKFADFIRLCAETKAKGVTNVIVAFPWAWGTTTKR